jgi:hypothetical protein
MRIAFLGVFDSQKSKRLFAEYFPYRWSRIKVKMQIEEHYCAALSCLVEIFHISEAVATGFLEKHRSIYAFSVNCEQSFWDFSRGLSAFLKSGKVREYGNYDCAALLKGYKYRWLPGQIETQGLRGYTSAAVNLLKNAETRRAVGKFLFHEIANSNMGTPIAAEVESAIVDAYQSFAAKNEELQDALWSAEEFRPLWTECCSFLEENLRRAGVDSRGELLVPDASQFPQLLRPSMGGNCNFQEVARSMLEVTARCNWQNPRLISFLKGLSRKDMDNSIAALALRLENRASESPTIVCRLCLAQIIGSGTASGAR